MMVQPWNKRRHTADYGGWTGHTCGPRSGERYVPGKEFHCE